MSHAKPEDQHYLRSLFEPRSVAIVGATDRPGRIGHVLVRNMLAAGFRGTLFGVNLRRKDVLGVPCFTSLDQLPQPVELAVIATPAATIPGLIGDCGRAGVRAAVIITAGFGETGAAGAALERQALATARQHGVRIMGPNCLGLLRPALGLNASFARGSAKPGGTALVSQSGAVCTAMLDWAAHSGAGFSSVVSIGGSLDVGFGETLDYLAGDPSTRHILLYIEGIRDARSALASLRAAARAKPVVLMKVGRHPVGSRAAVSHTGAIVGEDDVFDAALRRTGALRVQSFSELIGVTRLLNAGLRPRGPRLAIITNGGGPGVMAADRAADLALPLAKLSAPTVARLETVLPANWSHGNPLDLIGDADSVRYQAAVSACLADAGVDGVLVMLTPQAMTDAQAAASAVIEAARGSDKPVVACWMGESSVVQGRRLLEGSSIPAFSEPEAAVEAFAALASLQSLRAETQFVREIEDVASFTDWPDPQFGAARAVIDAALAAGHALLDAGETRALLRAFHVPVTDVRRAGSAAEAVAAADAAGYPVAMKIRAAHLTHKSDVGGVRLDLANAAGVRAAYAEMMAAVAKARPDAVIEGVTVEPMVAVAAPRELLIGIKRDQVFGPAITFGAGGTAVEVLRDRSVALPPLNAWRAGDMINATRIAKLLGEFRGAPPADRRSIIAVLLRISEMACEIPEILELDINPLLAGHDRVIALDARVLLSPPPALRPQQGRRPREAAHLAILPFPRKLVTTKRLDDGTLVRLRPIRAEDAGLEQAFVHGLSEKSVRSRFMHAMRSLPPGMLARFVDIDYEREMAFVALYGEGANEAEVGVARYVPCADGDSCEFAVVVADSWQRRGLGRQFMQMLISHARARGFKRMMGQVMPDNLAMLGLCRSLGFETSPWSAGGAVRVVSRSL